MLRFLVFLFIVTVTLVAEIDKALSAFATAMMPCISNRGRNFGAMYDVGFTSLEFQIR